MPEADKPKTQAEKNKEQAEKVKKDQEAANSGHQSNNEDKQLELMKREHPERFVEGKYYDNDEDLKKAKEAYEKKKEAALAAVKAEVVLEDVHEGEIGIVTPVMTEGEFEKAVKDLDVISMIRYEA